MNVYNARPVSLTIEILLIKVFIHLFQCNKRFQAIEFVNRPVSEKFYIFALIFPKFSSQNTGHAALITSFQSLLGTPRAMTFLLAGTHEKKKERKKEKRKETPTFLESRCLSKKLRFWPQEVPLTRKRLLPCFLRGAQRL